MMRRFLMAAGVLLASLAEQAAVAQQLSRKAPEAEGVPSAAIEKFVDAIEQIDQMNSMMLLRHGKVIAEGWWAPYQPEDPHMLYSLSKSFTSTAVGMAAAEGKLSVNDAVLSFFPDDAPANPSDKIKAMRIRDLLAMNTGHHADFVKGFDWKKPGLVKQFLTAEVGDKPGTHFEYNTPATYMCSAVVQQTTGEKVVDYLQPRLFKPLGITNPTWSEHDGITSGGFGLSIRTEDIAKFGQLYLNQGNWRGAQLIPSQWVAEATAKQVSNGSNPESDWEQGYGYQFWRARHNAYRGDGAFGQFCVVMPEQQSVLVITSGVKDMQAVLNAVWDSLLPALADDWLAEDAAANEKLKKRLAKLTVPPQQGNPGSPSAEKYSGVEYEFADNKLGWDSMRLTFEGGGARLRLKAQGQEFEVPIGFGAWKRGGRLPFSDGLTMDAIAKTAATGAWTGDDAYEAKIVFYETPFYANVTFKFADDGATVDSVYNVSFGAPRMPTLAGIRKP